MDTIQSEEIKWLWYPYIPYGKLTIVQGDPGEGKTTFARNLAAKLSLGENFENDDESEDREPISVIYQTAEDGLADTVKPRLEAAGADCSKILVIDESEKSISMKDDRIDQTLEQTHANYRGVFFGKKERVTKKRNPRIAKKGPVTKLMNILF